MRVLQINTFYKYGSTGRIMYDLKKEMDARGVQNYIAFGFDYEPKDTEKKTVYRIDTEFELIVSKILTKVFGHHGFYNRIATIRLLRWIDSIHPDIIHMHNIHNHYVNIKILLEYVKKKQIPCVMTLHDCWPFTGHCAYFDYSKCVKWKTGCSKCPNLRDYPKTYSLIDPSSWNYKQKAKLFNAIDITFVSPSQWLCNLQKQSFLKNKPCVVINNGVDISVFYPKKSNIRERYGLENKKIILVVSAGLEKRKGREYILSLPEKLIKGEVLIVVGIQQNQKKFLNGLPRVIGIPRTKTSDELVELYSEADVFVNPTLEDNFPTTNIEALACGTPVVAFSSGGSAEVISTETGISVETGNMNDLVDAIRTVLKRGKFFYQASCRRKAEEEYNKTIQYHKYIKLYQQILCENIPQTISTN